MLRPQLVRREEVALLAGVSIDYYVRMERGYLSGTTTLQLNQEQAPPAGEDE